ncbi:hypothetical protein OAD98_00145 [Flavobacteriales bacterium]|jgi:hypothetical protein|nr:hypothetical protein [bacterium]MDB9931691.1 hypothetical protein [Flavobacteriales bacterium]MDC0014955.1 hypothetical protein [Flavobacteriales bacterium]MDG1174215.1 hypothetical protein [Flavobacteriales bacterium]|tara:strand:- start:615 stop:989 length:375 start_codon:yes stop_codon:yes gene_type:complete
MEKSELILSILKLTIEGEKYEKKISQQIQYLNVKDTEHTGIGLFVYFDYNAKIEQFRLSKTELEDLFGDFNHQLEKYELINSSKNILADLTVHFENGIIDCIEIWNKTGAYPIEELTKFEIKKF